MAAIDYNKPGAQAVLSDLKLTNKLVMNILYAKNLFKAMMTDIDKAGKANKVFTVVSLALAVLEKTKEQFKRKMTPECLFGTGMNILDKINKDVQATGREGMSKEEMAQAAKEMLEEYITKHKNELDMADITEKLKQMQKVMASGELVAEMTKVTGQKPGSLNAAIARELKAPQAQQQTPKKGILQ